MTKKIYCKMLSQNIYLRECSPLSERDVKITPQKKYFELQRDTVSNGIVENLVELEYPITEDEVNSHLQSADYRNDVVSAMNQSARGSNLGDVTAYQEFIRRDPEQALRIYKETISKLDKALSSEKPVVSDDNFKGEEK